MKGLPMKVIGGVLLIVAGVLFLLQELALLGNAFEYLWLTILALGGGFFLFIFISEPDQWWAVIPGLALTFSLVGLLPGQAESRWAFIPAAALALLGISLLITIDRAVINMIWPAVLILIGGYLLVRNLF